MASQAAPTAPWNFTAIQNESKVAAQVSAGEKSKRMGTSQASEAQIASALRQAAELLQAQGANPFRVNAYRKAADTVEKRAGELHLRRPSKGMLEAQIKGHVIAQAELVGTYQKRK